MKYIDDYMELFVNLNEQSKRNEFFNRIDTTTPNGMFVTIFSYYLGSYTDWCFDGVRESRGIMFKMDSEHKTPIRIACRPMEKFFNFGENPLSMIPLRKDDIELIQDKADGSLISTYIDSTNDSLQVKSKSSVSSVYTLNAMKVIIANDLYDVLETITKSGYTVNMEYVSPDYRIVLPYEKDNVIIFNIRHNNTGEYLTLDQVELLLDSKVMFDKLKSYWVETFDVDELDIYTENEDQKEGFIESLDKINLIRDEMEKNKEGFIIKSKEHGFIKIKGKWYITLHRLKDSINSNKALFNAIVEQVHDDIMANFLYDEYAVKKIITFERIYSDEIKRKLSLFNEIKKRVKGVDNRKEYVMMFKDELKEEKIIFNLMMLLFDKKEFDLMDKLNEDFMKHYKQFVPIEYYKDDLKEDE